MKRGFGLARSLVWLTQLGFSVAGPLVLFIVGAVWLTRRYAIGEWVIILGVALGIMGAIGGLSSSLKAMSRLAGGSDRKDVPPSFNDHT